MKKYVFGLLVLSGLAYAGSTRYLDVDILRSSNHSKVWTPPSATDTLVGRASTDTLTNKTLTSPAINGANLNFGTATDTNRLLLPADTTTNLSALTNTAGLLAYDSTQGKPVFNNGSTWTAVGSGSGSGGVNYASSLFDGTSVTGINQYNDGASSTPTDGTGGTVTGPTTGTTTAAGGGLRASSQAFDKDASNRQGDGWSYDFTLDRADYEGGTPVIIQFNKKTTSAYASNDIRLFAYDKDASALLSVSCAEDSSGNMLASTTTTESTCWFYPNSSDNHYRLIWHITSTNASAWTFQFVGLKIGPNVVVPGAIVTDWQAFTPTGNWTNNSTYTGFWRRVGGDMEIQYKVALSGAPNNTILSFNMPSGYTIDSSRITTGSSAATSWTFEAFDSSATASYNLIADASVSSNAFFVGYQSATSGAKSATSSTAPFTWASGDYVSGFVKVPITGWTPGASLSTTDTLFKSVRVRAENSAGTSLTNSTETDIPFATELEDNFSAFDGTTFTAPRTAPYLFNVSDLIGSGTASSSGQMWTVLSDQSNTTLKDLYQGGMNSSAGLGMAGSAVLYLKAGDQVKVRIKQTSGATRTLNNTGFNNHLEITELPDLTTFGTYGQFQILTATSSTKTPTASGNWSAMTSNSIPLPAGTWRLSGYGKWSASGTVTYSRVYLGWFGANGADSSSLPATALSAVSGVTILSAFDGSLEQGGGVSEASTQYYNAPSVVVRCTNNCTVYLVPYAVMTTAANSRIIVYATAERLQ